MRKIGKTVAIVLLLVMTFQVEAQMTSASLVVRLVKPLLEKAITAAVPSIQESGPFIEAVVQYLEKKPDYAASSFIEGLVNNNIVDPSTVVTLINAIKGVSVAAYVGLSLAGQGDAAGQIAAFATFMSRSPLVDRWSRAVAAGDKVLIVNHELIIESAKPAPTAVAEQGSKQAAAPAYVQVRNDEVMPLLNILHGSPGATILLDDEVVGVSKYEEYMFQSLPPGKHFIAVRNQYAEGRMQIFVNPGRKTEKSFDQIEIKLARGSFSLEVPGPVAGMLVYLDGKFAGSTPFKGSVQAGPCLVELKSEWTDPWSEKVDGKAGNQLKLEPKMDVRGAVALEGNFPGTARAEIDGKAIDSTFGRLYLAPGRHVIRMSDDTIFPFEADFPVTGGTATRFKAEPRFRTGKIVITGLSAGMSATIDGSPVKESEDGTMRGDLVIGEHALAIAKAWGGGESVITKRVSVAEGGFSQIDVASGGFVLAGVPADARIECGGADATAAFSFDQSAGLWRSPRLLPGTYKIRVGGDFARGRDFQIEVSEGDAKRLDLAVTRLGKVRLEAQPAAGVGNVRVQKIAVFDSKGANVASENSGSATFNLPAGAYTARATLVGDIDAGAELGFSVEEGKSSGPLGMRPGFSVLYKTRERTVEIARLEAMRAMKKKELEPLTKKVSAHKATVSFFGWSGIAAAGTSMTFMILGNNTINQYRSAQTSAEATDIHNKLKQYSSFISMGLGGGAAMLTIALLASTGKVPVTAPLEATIADLDAKIANLKGGK